MASSYPEHVLWEAFDGMLIEWLNESIYLQCIALMSTNGIPFRDLGR